jgi:hypothetical protein
MHASEYVLHRCIEKEQFNQSPLPHKHERVGPGDYRLSIIDELAGHCENYRD